MQLNLTQELAGGHSKAIIQKVAGYIGNDQNRFNSLIIIFLQNDAKITPRAAWALSQCVENHPALIQPHFNALLKMLAKPQVHDSVKRNSMRLLQFVDIPKRYQGAVAEAGFRLMDPKEAIAVRVFSMTVLANIARLQPALKNELSIIIEDQLPYSSAAYQSRAKKILKELKK